MNEEDLQAVRDCITDKWHKLAQLEFYTDDWDEPVCALCTLDDTRVIRSEPRISDCDKCCVRIYTKRRSCKNTPYIKWATFVENNPLNADKECMNIVTCSAKAEIKLLLKFLPKGETVEIENTTYTGTGEAYEKLTNENTI